MILEEIYEEFPRLYKSKNDDIWVSESPLLNCQTYTIGGIDSIMYKMNPLEELKNIHSQIGKNQLLIDVSERWVSKFETLFQKQDVIFRVPYRNTTGNNMEMFLLKTEFLRR